VDWCEIMPRDREELLAEMMPHNRIYQNVLLVTFISIWILDSFVLHFSTFFLFIIPIWYHLIPALVIFFMGLYLINVSYKNFLDTEETGLVTAGIFSHIRHPMYLGYVLSYLALAIGTFSFASIIIWVAIFIVYNAMANYEDVKLEEKFGDVFLEYKNAVPKWLPR
jgi:protein-S-isoprenylcysteine O-methyltransferase Ste14